MATSSIAYTENYSITKKVFSVYAGSSESIIAPYTYTPIGTYIG